MTEEGQQLAKVIPLRARSSARADHEAQEPSGQDAQVRELYWARVQRLRAELHAEREGLLPVG